MICRVCKKDKPETEFGTFRCNKGYPSESTVYRLTICRGCDARRAKKYRDDNPDKYRAGARKSYHKHRPTMLARMRRQRLWAYYRLTEEQLEAMFWAQSGLCANCTEPLDPKQGSGRSYCIDHDHSCCPDSKSCGKCVRALVCVTCNTAIGVVENRLADCRAYIQTYQARP